MGWVKSAKPIAGQVFAVGLIEEKWSRTGIGVLVTGAAESALTDERSGFGARAATCS
jgi:hypothetical protein